MSRLSWDFSYTPASDGGADERDERASDVVVALSRTAPLDDLRRACARLAAPSVEPLVLRDPLFWWRVRAERPFVLTELLQDLSEAGLAPRYVAPADRPCLEVPAALDFPARPPERARGWRARRGAARREVDSPGRWFLRDATGVAVEPTRFNTGAGSRLAVIDDDAASVERVPIDAEVLVNLPVAPRSSLHGATMVALAVGTRAERGGGAAPPFMGVAPCASPRLYCIPKPGLDVFSLPLAIVRAVSDGADVIVCATYVEGTTSPMLDDALELAARRGRGGRGAAVVFPVGRETSSPRSSVHASLSLSLADPASDPRVFAIGPSGQEGGWFCWRDRKGKLRPFANRGPAVRWLAPGDDLAFPFAATERLAHAESSGASAIAAGVMLLVLSANPTLHLRELDAILTSTAAAVAPEGGAPHTLADPCDLEPRALDRDRHNAKHGYGRLHAASACLSAADPVAAALVAIGETAAASRYLDARGEERGAPYSNALGRWLVRAFAADATLWHAAKVIARHWRLVAGDPERLQSHGIGSASRQLALLLRAASRSEAVPIPSNRLRSELQNLLDRLRTERGTWEQDGNRWLAPVWVADDTQEAPVSGPMATTSARRSG